MPLLVMDTMQQIIFIIIGVGVELKTVILESMHLIQAELERVVSIRTIQSFDAFSLTKNGRGGGSSLANLEVHSSINLSTASPVSFQSSFSITVDIANTSGQQFNRDVAAALLGNNINFVNFIETKTAQCYDAEFFVYLYLHECCKGKYGAGHLSSCFVSKRNEYCQLVSNWRWELCQQYTLSSTDGQQRWFEFYAYIVPSKSPIMGAPFSVNTNFYNSSSADFYGEFSTDIYDMQAGWLASIDIKSMSLGAGNVCINSIDFSSVGLTTLNSGTYQLVAWMRLSGGNWGLGGNGNYANPVQVDLAAAARLADI